MCDKNFSAFNMLTLLALLLPIVPSRAPAQEEPKPLDPNDARLSFSFPIQHGGPPFNFKVQLDKKGTISAVSVYSTSASDPLQMLPVCDKSPDQVTKDWTDQEISLLIAHADLNFDGFEDLELLRAYVPHLDKKVYCIYLWNKGSGRFSYSKELSELSMNLEAHPESQTLTESENWLGATWQESTYRWNEAKLELIEQSSLLGDWSLQTKKHCGFTFTCSKLVKGKLVTTLEKSICTEDEMEKLPACPAAHAPAVPTLSPTEQHGQNPVRWVR